MDLDEIGLGTYKLTGDKCIDTVSYALNAGYKTIDTAMLYNNHNQIRDGIVKSNTSRCNINLISKIDNITQKTEKIKEAVDIILKELNTNYLDYLLLHSPIDNLFINTWPTMEEIRQSGKVKNIGVSNFEIIDLDNLYNKFAARPHINQFEISPFNTRDKLVKYCRENNIIIQAYGSLTRTKRFNDKKFNNICDTIRKNVQNYESITNSQILLKWALQKKYYVIPKTQNYDHLDENLQTMNLSPIDFEYTNKLDQLNDNYYTIPKYYRFD